MEEQRPKDSLSRLVGKFHVGRWRGRSHDRIVGQIELLIRAFIEAL